MAVLEALRDAGDALRRNPILFVATALYGLSQAPSWLLQTSGDPALSLVGSAYNLLLVFVAPLFVGGILAMAWDALDGATSLSRLWTGGKAAYVRLLAVFLLFGAGYFVVGIGVFFLVFALVLSGVIGGATGGAGGVSLTALAIVGLVGLGFALVLFLVAFFLQFYAQAVVVDGEGVVDALKRSYALVRQNLVAVLGFDALGLGLSLLSAAVPIGYVSLVGPGFGGMTHVSWGVRLGFVALALAAMTLVGTFGSVYAVAFYGRIRE